VAAEHGEPGLFLRSDDLEADAGFLPYAFDEVAAVDGSAAGLGGDGAGQRDVAPLQFLGADRERGHRPVHRRVGDPAASRQPLAEPDHPREGVDDDESVLGRASDQEPAIVGAEVERPVSVPGGAERPRSGRLGERLSREFSRTGCRRERSRSNLLRHSVKTLFFSFRQAGAAGDLSPSYRAAPPSARDGPGRTFLRVELTLGFTRI
jgi:hypothetical protein